MSATEALEYGVVDRIERPDCPTMAADRAESAVKDTPDATTAPLNGRA
jgi:hypothetical protein